MNLISLVHARGWSGLFNSFGGKDAPKLTAMDFIPFPTQDEAQAKIKRGISKRSAQIFAELVQRNQVPIHIVGAFGQWLDEIEELTGVSL